MRSPSGSHEPPLPAAYGSFGSRLHALLIDTTVVLCAMIVVIAFAIVTESVPGSGRIVVVAMVAMVALYEPLMVWRYGGTIGHRKANLRIVNDATGENPGLVRAVARFFIKSVLGLFSFVSMALTRRHQAIHDSLTGTTVRIRDLAIAQDPEIRWEREIPELAGMPSRPRRVAVIVGYSAVSCVVLMVALVATLSDACVVADGCSSGEELLSGLLGMLWVGVCAYFTIAGWRGRLWGCRLRQGLR